MVNIVDSFCWEPHRKILTPEQSGIPVLRCFGLHTSKSAGLPLYDHIHKGCMELVFLLKGFQIYEASGCLYNLSGYDIFVAYPDEVHSSATYPQNVSSLIWMQLELSGEGPLLGLDGETSRLLRRELLSLPRLFSGDSALEGTLTDAFFLLRQGGELERCMGQQTLVYSLLRMISLSRKLSVRKSDCVEKVIPYLYEHLSEEISLEEAAAFCGLSLSQFKKKFREESGDTPRNYINHLKVEQAKLLLDEGRSITDTALALGFNTPNYFSVTFRRYTGLSPTQYLARRSLENSREGG